MLQLRLMTLRASTSVQSRSLYERTFLFEDYNAPRSHNAFLAELAQILPENCCPLIVIDTWFQQVASHGWFWLGRVRGDVSYGRSSKEPWLLATNLPAETFTAAKVTQIYTKRMLFLSCVCYYL
jgi:hypothetical protein